MRDLQKRRLDVALERDSATLASLSRDAQLHHMSDQLGKMATIRLADYYLIAERVGTYSAEGILAALAMVSGGISSSRGEVQARHIEKEERYAAPAESLGENADEAADVWGLM